MSVCLYIIPEYPKHYVCLSVHNTQIPENPKSSYIGNISVEFGLCFLFDIGWWQYFFFNGNHKLPDVKSKYTVNKSESTHFLCNKIYVWDWSQFVFLFPLFFIFGKIQTTYDSLTQNKWIKKVLFLHRLFLHRFWGIAD